MTASVSAAKDCALPSNACAFPFYGRCAGKLKRSMSQVETVALWAGLIASVAGIVLSIVAMVFAIWVNNRATDVNNQMIKSLQKIESTVERVSTDTRELIAAGWNKLLGNMNGETDAEAADPDVPDQISSGLASEVRSELMEGASEGDTAQKIERIERALQELQETVSAQLRRRPVGRQPESLLDSLVQAVRDLPMEAKALLSILVRGKHMDRKQYRAAQQNQVLKFPIRALRGSGLLVPLEGLSDDGEPVPVYHLAPGIARRVRIATRLTSDVPKDLLESVSAALKTIGYDSFIS